MLFNEWYIANADFIPQSTNVDELRGAWESLEEDGVDGYVIGRSFSMTLHAYVGASFLIVEEPDDDFLPIMRV